jgi:predicted nucleic acid-binding protein
VTWGWTRVELASAVERRFRQQELTREERRACLDRFETMAAGWDEVTDLIAVRTLSIPLLARHSIRAADAAQLAAAMLVSENDPSSLTFVALDARLSSAAEREGFRLPT